MGESSTWLNTIFKWLGFGRYSSTPAAGVDGETRELQCDSLGALHVRLVASGQEPGSGLAASMSRPAAVNYQAKRAVKASGGTLFQLRGFNSHASNARYLLIFDSPTEPGAATVPKESIYVPASTNFSFDVPEGIAFANGIYVAVSTTGDQYTADAGGVFWFVARYL